MESAISQQDSLSHSTHEYQFENNLHRNNIRNRMNKAILEIFRRFVYPANLTTRNPNTIKAPIKLSTVQWTLIILLNRFLTMYENGKNTDFKIALRFTVTHRILIKIDKEGNKRNFNVHWFYLGQSASKNASLNVAKGFFFFYRSQTRLTLNWNNNNRWEWGMEWTSSVNPPNPSYCLLR